MTARRIATATLAFAVLAIGAPAWPCGPPSSMDNNGGASQQGNANNGGMGGQGQGDNNGGSQNWNNNNAGGANANGDSNGGRGDTWDNSGGENARQAASNQANSDLGDDNNGGSRRSGGGQNQNGGADYSNQIGSAGQSQAASDAVDCRAIRTELDTLQAEDPEDGYKRANLYLTRVSQMTPAMLDKEIADERAELDYQRQSSQSSASFAASLTGKPAPAPIAKYGSAKLDLLLSLRAAQASGIGQDTMQQRVAKLQAQARADTDARTAQRRQRITDLQNRLANLNCDTYLPAANQNVDSPSPSPSPDSQ
jgi:hypothetical protein